STSIFFNPFSESNNKMTIEKNCTLIVPMDDRSDKPNQSEIKKFLENGTTSKRIEALKEIISSAVNGEPLSPQLLMIIIRFVLPLKDKTIKKLLLLFWEVIDLTDENGKLKPEIILVW